MSITYILPLTKGNFLIFHFSPVVICRKNEEIPFGQHTKNDGQSPLLIGKSTISMAMFNSFLYVYQRLPLRYKWVNFQFAKCNKLRFMRIRPDCEDWRTVVRSPFVHTLSGWWFQTFFIFHSGNIHITLWLCQNSIK